MHDDARASHVGTRNGLTRRQLLERGALASGAVLAAQGLGVVSAFAQASPPPPDPTDPPTDPTEPPDPTGSLPENFQLVVEFGGEAYGVKYEPGVGWTQLVRGGACTFDTSYNFRGSPALLSALSAAAVSTGSDADGHRAYLLVLPDDVTFVEGRPKDDSCIGGPGTQRDPCGGHVERRPDGTYAFAACD